MSVSGPWFLETERLGLRTWRPDDFELAWALWGDARVTEFVGGPFGEAEVRERLAREMALQERHGMQYWPLFLRSGGTHAGCCGLRPRRLDDRLLELGFHLRAECWGNGYAGEAARAVIGFAFGTLGCRALFAGHHPRNTGSKRLLEKLGFHHTHDELFAPTGLMHPSYLLQPPSGGEA